MLKEADREEQKEMTPGLASATGSSATVVILKTLARGIAAEFGEHCEVVVHDLIKPEASIVFIANGHVTGRVLGGPLVGGPFGDEALKWMNTYGTAQQWRVYETRTMDGKSLKSMTAMFRDDQGRPTYALCINLETAPLVSLVGWAASILEFKPTREGEESPPPANQSAADVDEILSNLIVKSMSRHPGHPKKISREARFEVIRELDAKGAFLIKGAVRQVARAVGVSKFTIYNDLERLRNQEDS